MSPDPYQQKAIDILGGHHLVLAPPGCGKTDILTHRILRAHELGVDYSDMACLTFTNRAAKGMQERIVRHTKEPVPADLFIGNIHRLCATFLFEQGLIPQNAAIIDEFDFDSIIRDLATNIAGPEWGKAVSPHNVVNLQHALRQKSDGVPESDMLHPEALDAVGNTMSTLIESTGESIGHVYEHIDELWVRLSDYPSTQAARLMQLARAYERYKADNDMLDYDDLIVRTYHETTHLDDYPRFRWIQVDEVQDLSAAQLAIVDRFTSPDDSTVVYLGDEQQAIFSFIGAKMETLEALRARCQGNIHHLYRNYRSPKYLLDVVNAYAVQQLNIDPSVLPSTDNTDLPSRDNLYVLQTTNSTEQYTQAVRQAMGYAKVGNGKVAVVVPFNVHADKVSEAFAEQGIPHFKISGTDLFSTPTVQTLFAHLAIAQNEGGFTSWAKLLYHGGIIAQYTKARNFMRTLRKVGMIPTDFILFDQSTYLQQFSDAYDQRELVIFDTETTGLDVYTDEIIQIAAIKVRNGQVVEGSAFNVFLEISKEIPPVLKGNMVNPMVEAYAQNPHVGRKEGLQQFIDYCQGCVLVGHNVEYDYHILDYNLRRDCPEVALANHCPEYYDTLKYARLVEPRQRHYTLERLIEAFHLEGINSHMADADIMATKSLLDYCRDKATEKLQRQQLFWKDHWHSATAQKIKERYGHHYLHTLGRLYEQEPTAITQPLLVKELDLTYQHMCQEGMVDPIQKWRYILDYLTDEVINPVRYTSLREQLAHYNGDLLTSKEADLCGSRAMKDQFFVSTVHKAKGLEFESVIILEANHDKYPHVRSTTPTAVQEDARKFYVALSRATKRLCIICGPKPTPFLNSIGDQFYWYTQQPDRWALTSKPTPPDMLTAKSAYRNGTKMRHLGKPHEALPFLEKALEFNPSNSATLLQLADLHLQLGNRAESSRCLAQAPAARLAVPQPSTVPTAQSDAVVMYHPNPVFEQSEAYPLLKNPLLGKQLLPPFQGPSGTQPTLAPAFAEAIRGTIPGVFVHQHLHIALPDGQTHPLTIVVCNQSINLFIDVEIDVPYDLDSRHTLHDADCPDDEQRDRLLAQNGWIVLRFSERQARLQEYECLMHLYDIVNSAFNGAMVRFSNLAFEPRWNDTTAQRWQRERLREHYLGLS